MCFRCLQNDTPPTDFMRAVYARMDAELPADANGAAIVDETFRAFREAGPPPGALFPDHLGDAAVRALIRTAKRSGVAINSEQTTGELARPVLRACASGLLCVPDAKADAANALADLRRFNARVKAARLLMRTLNQPGLEAIFLAVMEYFYAAIERPEPA